MIAILVNSRSGKGSAKTIGIEMSKILEQKKRSFTLYNDNWPALPADVSEVWLVGGDGTFNYYLNRYKNTNLPMSIFPAGTGNDFAHMLYGKINIAQQVDKVLHAVPCKVDVGKCNDQLYINSAGLGFDGEVLKSIQSIRMLGGKLGYMIAVIKNIFSFKEARFKIHAENHTWDKKFLLVAFNNAISTGGGIKVSPKALLSDGLMDLVLCDELPIWKRLKYLPVIEKGKHMDLSFITYGQYDSIQIESSRLISGQLDGETIQGTRFLFTCLPGHILIKF